jgi:serine phosphatase RsbU (regulator of sigma subunit)
MTAGFAAVPEASWQGWLSYVAEASDLLAGTLDEERLVALLAQLVVPRLAVWCAVYVADDRLACVWHTDEELADPLRAVLTESGPPLQTVPGPWPEFSAGVTYVLPLVARRRRIGAMVIGGERFARGAVELAEELGRRAALALDNARLYAAQLAMSRALQRSLLPPALPDIPGIESAVVYEPAGEGAEVGGDFYDLFAAPGGDHWRFAVGDVCGTGPEAAAVTGLARHALRILAAEDLALADVLTRLNRIILAEGSRSRLMTLLHGDLCPGPDGTVRMNLVSAGHPLPLVLRPDGTVREAAVPQPLLGVMDEVKYEPDLLVLYPGEVMLCVTDGVTERRDGARMLGDDQGLERLLGGCTGLSAGAVAARIQRAVHDYGAAPSEDDLAIVVFRVG